MVAKIPVISSRSMIRVLEKAGFVVQRQNGSHVILKRDRDNRRTIVPNHPGDLNRGITKAILDQAGLTAEDLTELL